MKPILLTGSNSRRAAEDPIVRRTVKLLRRQKPDYRGTLQTRGRGVLAVTVTRPTLDRLEPLADALVHACQERGFLQRSRARDADTALEVCGQRLEFTISEYVRRTEKRETEAERRRRHKAEGFLYQPKLYEYHPTGRLTLRIDGSGEGERVSWGDGKRRRLEDQLNDIMLGLVRLAVARRLADEQRAAERRAWEREWQLREERRRQIEAERAEVEKLEENAKRWERAERLRRYVGAVEHRERHRVGRLEPGTELHAWTVWASEIADVIDPLEPATGTRS